MTVTPDFGFPGGPGDGAVDPAAGLPPLDALPAEAHLEVLDVLLPVEGRRVVDVGCGDGALVRALARRGASVIGVEVDERALARARAAEPAGAETYRVGRGEALPLDAGSVDVVVFFNSLHHVPAASQPAALDEAARILAPGGRLYVAEPIAAGPSFELVRPIDDETAVRAAAFAALRRAEAAGRFRRLDERLYRHAARYRDLAAFREKMLAVSPGRAAALDADAGLAARFEALGRPVEEGRAFDQPMRATLLERV